MTIEDKLKELILSRYKSIREFTLAIDMPYTTIDSMFRRGVENSSVAVVIKVCKGLGISADALAEGKIVPKSKVDYVVYGGNTQTVIEVQDILSDTKERLLQYGNLLLDGKPINDETKKAIAHGIDVSVEMAKTYNKNA
jgi:hypothetical protein